MEGVELKTVNPVVFDDAEFCENNEGRCKFLNIFFGYCCKLFHCNLNLNGLEDSREKCQECKDHYLKNKTE